MQIRDIVCREIPPRPWAEGEKIPWDDPGFSERMLREHLSQSHDMASRRSAVIDRHVGWIHESILEGRPSRILDLGCGPGFYTHRLAKLGHGCTGIDFSPASIVYAQSAADQADLLIDYVCHDIRTADYGNGFDLAMLVYGEFNVFSKRDAGDLLAKISMALNPGGYVLLEAQTHDAIQKDGQRPPAWHTEPFGGLFSTEPHLWLQENFWHADCKAATTRYYIVNAATGDVDRYAATSQAYSPGDLDRMLEDSGFREIRRFPSLAGDESHIQEGLFVVVARKE